MVVQPRRPTSEEYLEIERYLMEQSFIKYNYTWPEGSEVLLILLPMCGSRGGGQGVWTPLENYKNIGFLSNTGSDPLKSYKATYKWRFAGGSMMARL